MQPKQIRKGINRNPINNYSKQSQKKNANTVLMSYCYLLSKTNKTKYAKTVTVMIPQEQIEKKNRVKSNYRQNPEPSKVSRGQNCTRTLEKEDLLYFSGA